MGNFLNQYVTDMNTIIPLGIGSTIILIIFSILYNRWMSDLGNKKDSYTALFVALGNLVTLLIVAVFSWKSALIALLAFVASGTTMIIGDVYRSVARREQVIAEVKKARRKPLPYVAARLIPTTNSPPQNEKQTKSYMKRNTKKSHCLRSASPRRCASSPKPNQRKANSAIRVLCPLPLVNHIPALCTHQTG
jgi:hypothetical protein